jgi:hypothetical protein
MIRRSGILSGLEIREGGSLLFSPSIDALRNEQSQNFWYIMTGEES